MLLLKLFGFALIVRPFMHLPPQSAPLTTWPLPDSPVANGGSAHTSAAAFGAGLAQGGCILFQHSFQQSVQTHHLGPFDVNSSPQHQHLIGCLANESISVFSRFLRKEIRATVGRE
jgi:hypothetical protein